MAKSEKVSLKPDKLYKMEGRKEFIPVKDSLCPRCQGLSETDETPTYPLVVILEQIRKDMEFQRARTETVLKMLLALTKNIEELQSKSKGV